MEFQSKYDLVRSVGEECVTDGELALLMARKPDSFILYDGFEPSGRMHIAQVAVFAFLHAVASYLGVALSERTSTWHVSFLP